MENIFWISGAIPIVPSISKPLPNVTIADDSLEQKARREGRPIRMAAESAESA
jgi:hypothetical protein